MTTTAPGYHMSDQLQAETLGIVAIAVVLIIVGILAISRDVRATWSIDDANAEMDELADDYWLGRDLHLEDVRDAMRAARSTP